jgi:hypothetical protein
MWRYDDWYIVTDYFKAHITFVLKMKNPEEVKTLFKMFDHYKIRNFYQFKKLNITEDT